MPILKPKVNQSKDDFISSFMSNDLMKKEFPQKQRLAVAHDTWRKSQSKKSGAVSKKKETRYCHIPISIKEDADEFYSEGFIATTHPDRAADPELDVNGDVLSKNVMHQISDFINDAVATVKSVGATRTVSLQHDWVKEGDPDITPAGMAVPPASVKETEDGHYGVHVKTHHNRNHPEFDQVCYDVKHGYLPGYSIEYEPGEFDIINVDGRPYRFLKTIQNFVGYAFASARKIANPEALITGYGYKEIEEQVQNHNSIKNKSKEVQDKMSEEQKQEEESQPKAEEETKKEEVTEAKVEESKKEEEEEEVKSEEESKPETEEKEVKSTDSKIDVKEIVNQVKESEEFKTAISELKVESKVMKTGTKEDETMNITVKQMGDALDKMKVASTKEQRELSLVEYKEAAFKYHDENDMFNKAINDPANYTRGFKSNLKVKCVGKGMKIVGGLQIKGTLDTASNTSSYTQAPVEFADIFAPGIIDTFNNQTTLWGFLRKEQHPGGIDYQWKMVTDKDPESNPTFVDRDDTTVLKNFASKENYQTPIKVARRGISVTDFANRYSARSLGDLFQLEVDLQMKEMMNDVNAALFAEVADGTGNDPLGLEAVADSAGNTTLYGKTRSTANRLSPAAAGDTYTAVGGAVTEALMRAKAKQLEVEGTRKGNIAIVASPNSRDLIFNLLDGNRRFITTAAEFGFNQLQVPAYDGYPIIVDADCNTDALYFIDTEADVIVMAMEPRMVALAKVGAATEAYVEMHFAHVYKQPRRIGMLDTLA